MKNEINDNSKEYKNNINKTEKKMIIKNSFKIKEMRNIFHKCLLILIEEKYKEIFDKISSLNFNK